MPVVLSRLTDKCWHTEGGRLHAVLPINKSLTFEGHDNMAIYEDGIIVAGGPPTRSRGSDR